ncbi:hypothetical protein MSIBF_A1770014 [groundwater metagenome]|uniref:Uncharacterized protein n=1 Tax=groundwater metagenome TaxID=717931 RepID=A0A098EAA9_9ZZZZ
MYKFNLKNLINIKYKDIIQRYKIITIKWMVRITQRNKRKKKNLS